MQRPSALLQNERGGILFAKTNGASLQPKQQFYPPHVIPYRRIFPTGHSLSAATLSAPNLSSPVSDPVSLRCLPHRMRLSCSCTKKDAAVFE